MTFMRNRLLHAAFLVALAAIVRVPVAQADVYTWVDASGRINVSNLDPPAGVRVTGVARAKAPPSRPPDDAAREPLRQAEVKALADRVRQLQDEVEAVRAVPQQAPPPPPVVYRVVTPPAMPYLVQRPVPAMPYDDASSASGCNPSWSGCAFWWGPVFSTSVVVRRPAFHRFHDFRRGRGAPSRMPMRPTHGGRLR
jgi:hypothetical protein